MSYFTLGPREGVCMVDFWLVWCLQAIHDHRAEDAAYWAAHLAKFAHAFYPDTRPEAR